MPVEFLTQDQKERHGGQVLVVSHDAVDGVALGFQLFLETEMDLLLIALQEFAVHVDALVEGVAPGLVQETHEGEITARSSLRAGGRRRRAYAVEQVALIVAVDPADVGNEKLR